MSYTRPEKAIYQPLTVDGQPRSASQLIGDYSATPGVVYLQADQPLVITRLFPYIQDTGSFDSGGYGNGSALAQGLQVYVADSDDNVILDFFPSAPIKQNTDWKALCYDTALSDFGLGDESLGARWTFGKDVASDGLVLSDGRKFVVSAHDNHTNLVRHQFLIRGYYL